MTFSIYLFSLNGPLVFTNQVSMVISIVIHGMSAAITSEDDAVNEPS